MNARAWIRSYVGDLQLVELSPYLHGRKDVIVKHEFCLSACLQSPPSLFEYMCILDVGEIQARLTRYKQGTELEYN